MSAGNKLALYMYQNPRFITFTFGRKSTKSEMVMSSDTIFKLATWGIYIMVVLQVIFHFVFRAIGYDSLVLSITLVTSIVVFLVIFAVWKFLKKAVIKEAITRKIS